jgi:hypothetical protein
MTEKIQFLLIALVGMFSAAFAGYSVGQHQYARYQLFQGTHQLSSMVFDKPTNQDESCVLRLDTQTGHVDQWNNILVIPPDANGDTSKIVSDSRWCSIEDYSPPAAPAKTGH